MERLSSSRIATALIAGFAVVSAVALTLGIVTLARAGAVSVLPVTSQQTGITVCGHGVSRTKPDQAVVSVGVFATAQTAEAARAQAATAMNAILAALKKNGVADKDIQTQYFSIQPQYFYDPTKGSQPNGYTATNNVSATIHAVDKVGAILDAVTAAGGNNTAINGVQFSAGDPSNAQAEAQQLALTDAKRQGEKIAQAAGVSLGTPVSIQIGGCGSGGSTVYPIAASGDKSGNSSAPTPIQSGQVQVSADVSVVFAIR